MQFKDTVVIITGAARGIGRTAAEMFARRGATVWIWDVDPEQGNTTAASLQQQQLSVFFQPVDVTRSESVAEAVDRVRSESGTIHVLINNAGIVQDATLMKMEPRQWQAVLDVNLTGVFHCTQQVAPVMVQEGYGRIINTSSVVGLYGNFGQSNYVATKAGVIGLTKVWARELGRKGITVNAVAPGFVATEMVETVPQKVLDMVVQRTPVGRLGSPEDVAYAYLFLASREAGFINGAVLSVDGGFIP
ncbi:MAG: 3-oxoacyl-ACP reductase FabG [Calditrichaeota bacterium]|nr:3-oxoacyl-ACP reductase FabG [Calditrichota bacterium]